MFGESSNKDVTSAITSLIKNSATVVNQTDYDFEYDLVLAIPCRSWPLRHISAFIERIHQSTSKTKSELNNFYKLGNSETKLSYCSQVLQ